MNIRQKMKLDLDTIMEKDPAATTRYLVKRTYSGYKALCAYRCAHELYLKGHKTLAFLISARAKRRTGAEIHPAAKIGNRIFIDHATGLVIGETAVVGDNCVLYQGVTLGGTGKETGQRHPILEDGVMVSSGAKILGPVRIGANSKIGAGSVVLKDVPKNSTVVGVPGRLVRQDGKKIIEMDQFVPDPVVECFERIEKRLAQIESKLNIEHKTDAFLTDNKSEKNNENI